MRKRYTKIMNQYNTEEIKYNKVTGLWESRYWLPAVTADAVVFGYDGEKLNILLVLRGNEPYKGEWALPGGFMRKEDADMEECVRRELKEETSVELSRLELFGVYSDENRDSRGRVISIAFFALVAQNKFHIVGGDDAANARWFPVDELPKLAFDHDKIIGKAKEELGRRIHFEPIGFELLNKEFTMPQLQNIYIAILNPPETDSTIRDRRNFPKKMLKLGYIKDTGKKMTGNAYRSPRLYTFDEDAYNAAKEKGIRLQF